MVTGQELHEWLGSGMILQDLIKIESPPGGAAGASRCPCGKKGVSGVKNIRDTFIFVFFREQEWRRSGANSVCISAI